VEVRFPGGAVVDVEAGPEGQGEAVVGLTQEAGLGALGVDAEPVVAGDGAARHAGLPAPHVDLHDVGDDGLVLVVHADALRHPGRELATPLGFLGALGQHRLVPCTLEQAEAEVHLVLPEHPGQLVKDNFVEGAHLA
jgi:hypothetical protein